MVLSILVLSLGIMAYVSPSGGWFGLICASVGLIAAAFAVVYHRKPPLFRRPEFWKYEWFRRIVFSFSAAAVVLNLIVIARPFVTH